jgi:hypothetical protein
VTREETGLRVQALETASRLSLPHELTLRAARAYLEFLQGKDPAGEWTVAATAVANQLRASLKKQAGVGKGIAKKAAPKRTTRD